MDRRWQPWQTELDKAKSKLGQRVYSNWWYLFYALLISQFVLWRWGYFTDIKDVAFFLSVAICVVLSERTS